MHVPEFAVNTAATVALTTNSVVGPNNAPSRFCHISPPWSALTQVKLFGTYALPWDLRASFNYQHLPGVATTATYVISGAEIAAALGRQPAAGARATASVELTRAAAAASRESIEPVELRALASVQPRRRRVQPGIELHNALNASTVHTLVTRYGPVWEGVRGVLTPRLIKLAVQVDF